ncbi:MAG: hypothetical protein R3308_07215 [Thiohalobacterales bacterium]|nr:hypothetical protein [Thiohalobacterales bacterium]
MNRLLKVLVVLPAIFFLITGLRWLLAPAGVAPQFGLTLGEGVGLSSQVGDMSAFFLLLGICMLTALVSGRRSWYYPPIILLALTAVGRIFAWLLHDAALAVDLIAPEVIVSVILLVASRRLPGRA